MGTVQKSKTTSIARALFMDTTFKAPKAQQVGLPRFRGQVDRSHAMTHRLSIDDQPNQDQAPVHASAEAGGY